RVDETVSTFSFWPDCDGDDFGDREATPVTACATPAASVPCESGGAWVMTGGDCDDAVAATNPGATERCNAIDDDCDDSMDEEIEIVDWYPDCDDDGYGDGTGTPVSGCAEPSELATCGTGSWADRAGDCADTNASRNPGATEVCNAIDDDCDTLVDDIDDGLVICRQGETRACDNTCGVGGTQTCTLACDGFGACSSAATEVCNYCDDDGDGLGDEVELATSSRGEEFRNCEVSFGDAICAPRDGDTDPPFFLDATVLDGRGDDRAGAVWFRPSDWVMGYGNVTVDMTMRLRAHPENSSHMIQILHGGWTVMVSTSGDPGVGSPRQYGMPTGHDGLALRWNWNTLITEPGDGFNGDDSVALVSLPGFLRRPTGSDPILWNGRSGVDVPNGTNAQDFNGQTTTVVQRVQLVYTPDDPRTPLANEERVQIFLGNSNAVVASYAAADGYPESPRNEIPPGNRFRIAVTAGTYSESGKFYLPPGETVGMPVEADVQLWRLQVIPPEGAVYDGFEARVATESLCP
ncbi:MAG: putative metal-binding motif-containing protein, partial [Myxococcales bacterium]|nr:putative metal-binding motif-containing protein [Myxococcales bacterium]